MSNLIIFYFRLHCKLCGFVSVNKNSLTKHCAKNHEGQIPNFESLPPNEEIEEWVTTLLKRQTQQIKRYIDLLSSSSGESVKSLSPSISKSPTKQPQSSSINLDSDYDDIDEDNDIPSDEEVSATIEDGKIFQIIIYF